MFTRRARFWIYLFFLVGCLWMLNGCRSRAGRSISGIVLGESGPIRGAVVRQQGTSNHTTSAEDGSFLLEGIEGRGRVMVTAWEEGFYIAGVEASPGDEGVEIVLTAHAHKDYPGYSWLPSLAHPGEGEDQGCAACHSREGTDLTYTLPVDEWLQDAHSQSAKNIRFLTMYTGSNVLGNKSQETRFGSSRDYGTFPLPPDPEIPYYGPGYKLDFPDTKGNCAACHTPAASIDDPYGVDPTAVMGVAAEGVPCDFCHKVWAVRLNPTNGLPHANMPGVLSFAFLRPPEGHQFFAGPLDDVAPGEDTYSPLQQQSQFCAPCHFGTFWDTIVYNSFGEWLDSPYSDPLNGKTCQDCHMPPLGVSYFARPDAGGLERRPETIFSHRMPGASDEDLLRNAVSMSVNAAVDGGDLTVDVTIHNDKTGHHVPTDSPLRQMILLVTAADSDGNPIPLRSGPTLPDWCGLDEGDMRGAYGDALADRDYAGYPGTAYARILMEIWTKISPSGAYWNPTRVLSDNRIPAFGADTTRYTFSLPQTSDPMDVQVWVRLIYRRAFLTLISQKGWDAPDILMESTRLTLRFEP